MGWSGGGLDGTGSVITMPACSGWRTLVSATPIADSMAYLTLEVKALRSVVFGVSVGDPELYVGESETSWGYPKNGDLRCHYLKTDGTKNNYI